MKHVTKLVKCNLVGVNGNAWVLMGTWQNAAKKQKTPPEEIKAVMDDCMSGDYDHLLQVLITNSL
jgi:predicted CoA-binding protein